MPDPIDTEQPDRLHAAADLAIEAGRKAKGTLRRLKGALVDAQEGEQGERVFWPFALFRVFSRGSRRRQIMELTKVAQVELAALDAAVDALREYGVQLSARPTSRATREKTPSARARSEFVTTTMWDGPLGLTQNTMLRVEVTLDELRSLQTRPVEPGPDE